MPAIGDPVLGGIETWIFDLDNTLYPASCRLFDQIHANMTRFIAERLLEHLGIAGSFCGIVDIVAAGYEPKPGPAGYYELLRRHQVTPAVAIMFEDMAKNLVPAAALGMTTAWVRNSVDWAADGSEGDHIHHVVDNLGGFLSAAASQSRSCPSPGLISSP